jgi:hypothetical protein
MTAPPQAFDMKRFHFVRSSALNSDTGKDIAKLYLESGRLRSGVQILGLDEHIGRLKSLVGVLQCNWGAANKLINSDQGEPDEESGERSSGSSPSDFVFGKGVPDNISGSGMLRAVANMVVFVVDCLEEDSPEKVPDDKAKRTHKLIVVAMFVEAIYALQHDKPSTFTTALFGDSLAKVAAYTSIKQNIGEREADFHLRTLEKRLEESEAARFEENKTHRETSFALEKAADKNKSLQHERDVDRRLLSSMAGTQTGLEHDLKESQSKCVQLEHELKDEKIKRARVARELEEVQSEFVGALGKVTQLEQDPKEEKSKFA